MRASTLEEDQTKRTGRGPPPEPLNWMTEDRAGVEKAILGIPFTWGGNLGKGVKWEKRRFHLSHIDEMAMTSFWVRAFSFLSSVQARSRSLYLYL